MGHRPPHAGAARLGVRPLQYLEQGAFPHRRQVPLPGEPALPGWCPRSASSTASGPGSGTWSPGEWLLREWRRTGLPLKRANLACGVQDAASRKYLDQTDLWYPPPPGTFQKLQEYANRYGSPDGRPYFNLPGENRPATARDWERVAAHPSFECPYGFTNIWDRPPLRGNERITRRGRTLHPNQKPLDLMTMIIRASTPPGGTVWETFGGLFTAAVAARNLERRARGAETDPGLFQAGVERLAATRPLAGILHA